MTNTSKASNPSLSLLSPSRTPLENSKFSLNTSPTTRVSHHPNLSTPSEDNSISVTKPVCNTVLTSIEADPIQQQLIVNTTKSSSASTIDLTMNIQREKASDQKITTHTHKERFDTLRPSGLRL